VLTSSPNPATYGKTVTLTAVVSPVAASGKVTFYDGSTVAGIKTLTAGQASLGMTLPISGDHQLKAFYQGDGVYRASTSAPLLQRISTIPANGFDGPVLYSAGTSPR